MCACVSVRGTTILFIFASGSVAMSLVVVWLHYYGYNIFLFIRWMKTRTKPSCRSSKTTHSDVKEGVVKETSPDADKYAESSSVEQYADSSSVEELQEKAVRLSGWCNLGFALVYGLINLIYILVWLPDLL